MTFLLDGFEEASWDLSHHMKKAIQERDENSHW